ncbi:MAG TPA: hypothetical protein VGF23_13295 [Gaiellaceae bacterium]
MTGMVGIFLAVAAGFLVAGRRQTATAVVVPFLGVLAVQSWGIASGRGVSAPSTVTAFPGLLEYYAVQAIILALALGIALQIRALRFDCTGREGRPPLVAYAVNCALAVLVVSAVELDRPLFDPGSVTTHTSSGPPALGIAGIALLVVVCLGLAGARLRHRPARA